jgi:hypothetical protein
LLGKKNYCEIQRSENWATNLAESSKEGYGLKQALLPMMVMTMMIAILMLVRAYL